MSIAAAPAAPLLTAPTTRPSLWREATRRFRRHRLAMVGFTVLVGRGGRGRGRGQALLTRLPRWTPPPSAPPPRPRAVHPHPPLRAPVAYVLRPLAPPPPLAPQAAPSVIGDALGKPVRALFLK